MISSNCSESSNQSLDPKEMFVYNLFAQSLLKPYLRQKQPYSFLKHKLSIFITHFFYKRHFLRKSGDFRQGQEVNNSDFPHFHICYSYNSQKQNPKIF